MLKGVAADEPCRVERTRTTFSRGGSRSRILTDPATGKTFYAHFFAVPSFDDLSTPVPVVPLYASARESAAYVQNSWGSPRA